VPITTYPQDERRTDAEEIDIVRKAQIFAEEILKTQINLLGKIERHLAIVTEEDIDDDEILIKEQ